MICFALQANPRTFISLDDRKDPECKYVIVTTEEYDELMAKADEYESLQKELAEVSENAEHFESLNKNLLRITKERANQSRGAENKKDFDGYYVLSSKQCTEKYDRVMTWNEYEAQDDFFKETHPFDDDDKPYIAGTAIAWRSVIQTPYSVDLQYDNIRGDVMNELCIWGVLSSMGCCNYPSNMDNGAYFQVFGEDGSEANVLYRILFNANYRSGLWEVEIYTTMPLIVSEDRKSPAEMKSDSKKRNTTKKK